jgi:hypothetical protein
MQHVGVREHSKVTDITLDPQPAKEANRARVVEEWAQRLQLAVIGCAVYFLGTTSVPDKVQKTSPFRELLAQKLRGSLASCVALHAQAYPDWSADGENVGFMVKIDGASFLRAPVHLVPLIPEKRFAALIWKLANEVRLSKNSIMALSGSNAVRRVFEYVDDIDFFEYVPDEPLSVKEAILKRIFAKGALSCEKASLGNDDFRPPFETVSIEEAIMRISPSDLASSSAKLGYVTLAFETRPLEVSNISAFVGPKFDGISRRKTFPFQEVLVSQREFVPSQLDDPVQVGEYVCWLISQIKKYKSEPNYLKASKRALNLARFCWFDDLLNELHFLFENTTAVHRVEIEATRRALGRILNGEILIDGSYKEEVEGRLNLLIAELSAKDVLERKYFPKGFEDSAKRIIQQLLERVADLSGGSIGND